MTAESSDLTRYISFQL